MSTPSETLPTRAESLDPYRWAHLLIVGSAYGEASRRKPLTLDRLAMYDFFTAHPFLVFEVGSTSGRRLVREGLEPRSLTYAAAPDRLANRRQRIQSDVTALVARDLLKLVADDGRLVSHLTERGIETREAFTSIYAQAVSLSAGLIVGALDRLTDKKLRDKATEWTSHRSLMIDVLEGE